MKSEPPALAGGSRVGLGTVHHKDTKTQGHGVKQKLIYWYSVLVSFVSWWLIDP